MNNTSGPRALSAIAGKRNSQYESWDFMTAVRMGEMQEIRVARIMATSTLRRWMKRPISRFTIRPAMGVGRKRIEVAVAERSWTSWKKNVRRVSVALKAPQRRKTEMQTRHVRGVGWDGVGRGGNDWAGHRRQVKGIQEDSGKK